MSGCAAEDQILSWIDREDSELDRYLESHPEDRKRVDAIRDGLSWFSAQKLPASIGPYRPVRKIGQGGMGVVFEARQPVTGRPVAVKVLRRWESGSRESHVALSREARALGRLSHPAIASVYEAGRAEDGSAYLAMEFVRGKALDDFVRERDLDRDDWLRLFLKVCDAVEYAHGHGVIHRDLKPANILVDDQGDPHVLDFGLARVSDETDDSTVTLSGHVMGSVPYMSPEQARGAAEITHAADVYALGVILYRLLLEKAPYSTEGGVAAALRTIVEVSPERPTRVQSDLDHRLEAVLLCALQKDPAQRYRDVASFAADVRRVLANADVHARPVGRPQRLRWTAAGLGVVAIAAFGSQWLGSETGVTPPAVEKGEEQSRYDQLLGSGYEKKAPFAEIQWQSGVPFVPVEGRFAELVEIEGWKVAYLVGFSQQTSGTQFWIKRFEEDLVEILTRVLGVLPPDRLRVQVRGEDGELREHWVQMTAEKRTALFERGRRSPFTAVRWSEHQPEVEYEGAWYDPIQIGGVDVDSILAVCRGRGSRDGCRVAFEVNLYQVLTQCGHQPGECVSLELRSIDDGELITVEEAPMTHINGAQLFAPWGRDRQQVLDHQLEEYARVAPFSGMRWNDAEPSVELDDQWYRLRAVDTIAVDDLLRFVREYYPKTWRTRLALDLVGIFATMGEPLGWEVELAIEDEGEVRRVTRRQTKELWEQVCADFQ